MSEHDLWNIHVKVVLHKATKVIFLTQIMAINSHHIGIIALVN